MKLVFIALCASCLRCAAQQAHPDSRFVPPSKTVSYYQLLHKPSRELRHLLDQSREKLRKKRYGDAISLLRSALSKDRWNWEAHVNLGAAYFWNGNFPEARTEFESATSLDPSGALAFADLAVCDWRDGAVGRAVLHAKQALVNDPEDGLAQRVLAAAKRVMH